MTAMSAQVVVIIAAYNASGTIARAVASALAEPEVAEVLVVDDHSTDDTMVQAQRADDGSGRLRVLRQPTNRGPAAARNRAMMESTSPWIAVLDADDFFIKGRMATLLAYTPDYDLIADDLLKVSCEDIEGPRSSLLAGALAAPTSIDFSAFVRGNVSRAGRQRMELGFIKPLMRRELLEDHRLYYREAMRLGEDYELYARALAHGGRLLVTPVAGYVAVVRPNSLSAQHSIADLQALRDCDAAIGRDFALTADQKQALALHYRSVDCRLQWRLLIAAAKARSLPTALACFTRSPGVSVYLVRQLLGEACVRVKRLLRT